MDLCTRHPPPRTTSEATHEQRHIAGNLKQLKGKIQARWGDLRDDDLQVVEGHADYLLGKLQERYGWECDRERTDIGDFKRSVGTARPS